jgi:hypothetical protein
MATRKTDTRGYRPLERATLVTVAAIAVSVAACGASRTAPAAGGGGGIAGTGGAGGDIAARMVDVGLGPFSVSTTPVSPLPMDDVTVFAFSQIDTSTGNETDPQVLDLAPDMSIRNWQHWDLAGTRAADYNLSYVAAARAAGIRFIGGTTATATFADEWQTPAELEGIVTRDASGAIVSHDNIVPRLRRGSLANPAFRAHLTQICRLQIDAGVDGLFFDEVNSGYQGAAFDGNEGFDDHHLADFNAYLLARYPAGTDFAALFDMPADNRLRADLPAGDLDANFDYRRYLRSHGWSATPFAPANPLAPVWGMTKGNRPTPEAMTFEDTADLYRYWPALVDDLRAYARSTRGHDIFVTSNGVFPRVDFQSVGLYDWNDDGDGGKEANYVPVSAGHLAGTISLQGVFRRLKARSEAFAPGAAVVLFLDWPGGTIDRYDALPAGERQDFWRLYAAEAYANGLFFAFHLRSTTGEPTATELGMMPFFKSYSAFYRAHASLFHGVTPASVTVGSSLPASAVALSVADQASPHRRLVHVVNHVYDAGFIPQASVTVTVASDTAPAGVSVASPDAADDVVVPFTFTGGTVAVTLPSLTAYDIIVLAY